MHHFISDISRIFKKHRVIWGAEQKNFRSLKVFIFVLWRQRENSLFMETPLIWLCHCLDLRFLSCDKIRMKHVYWCLSIFQSNRTHIMYSNTLFMYRPSAGHNDYRARRIPFTCAFPVHNLTSLDTSIQYQPL